MKNKILILIIAFKILSCSPINIQNCKVFVKNNVQQLYSLDFNCNYKTKISEKLDSGNELIVITFKDNSKVFITNEIEYCPPFSLLFLSEKQTGMFVFYEQLSIYGKSESSTIWRIEKRDGFILGYYDVPIEEENQYKKIIQSVKIK